MRLYDTTLSPNAKRVRVIARELGVPLEYIAVDLRSVDATYRAKNPTGKVPTLEDGDFVLWESGAILTYLALREDSALLPREPRAHAEVMRWMFYAATHLQPWLSTLGQERLIKPLRGLTPDAAAIAIAERELARFVPVVDQALSERQFLCGGFSLADIFLGCSFEGVERRGVELSAYPHISSWRARLTERPSWRDD
jgi:glutathione S-transferase